MTQHADVLDRLRKGPLTPGEALSELGVMRLSAVIYDLKAEGHAITSELVEVPTRKGTARVARYTLTETLADLVRGL